MKKLLVPKIAPSWLYFVTSIINIWCISASDHYNVSQIKPSFDYKKQKLRHLAQKTTTPFWNINRVDMCWYRYVKCLFTTLKSHKHCLPNPPLMRPLLSVNSTPFLVLICGLCSQPACWAWPSGLAPDASILVIDYYSVDVLIQGTLCWLQPYLQYIFTSANFSIGRTNIKYQLVLYNFEVHVVSERTEFTSKYFSHLVCIKVQPG